MAFNSIDEVIKETIIARKKKEDKNVAEVWIEIEKAASAGHNTICLQNTILSKKTIEKFRREGFLVKVTNSSMDDWGNFYNGWIEISWKKKNIFQKIWSKMRGYQV